MTTEQAKQVLREAGYYVDNLWHVNDVMDRFDCDQEDAQEILHDSLTNELIVEKIFLEIKDFSETRGLQEKGGDQ